MTPLPEHTALSTQSPSGSPKATDLSDYAEETDLVKRLCGTLLETYPLLMFPEQAAALLGVPCSTVRSMLESGQLPHRIVGRTKRIPLPALVMWLTEVSR